MMSEQGHRPNTEQARQGAKMLGNWLKMDWQNAVSEITRLIIVAALVLASALVLTKEFRNHAISQSDLWTKHLQFASDTTIRSATIAFGTPAEAGRFAAQSLQVRYRANMHLRIMKYFYSRYFASITMATFCSIAAALCLIHIGAVGWKSANNYVLSIFLTTAALAIAFRLSPQLYKQEENIAANKDLYTRYVSLDNEMTTYAATNIMRDSVSMSIGSVLVRVDSTLNALRDMPMGFDKTQIPDYTKLKPLE
jgi:hypothetical protein